MNRKQAEDNKCENYSEIVKLIAKQNSIEILRIPLIKFIQENTKKSYDVVEICLKSLKLPKYCTRIYLKCSFLKDDK